jgi:hypothetical protein
VIVLLDVRRNRQSHIVNSGKKPITSLSYSSDGRHIITGEVSSFLLRVFDDHLSIAGPCHSVVISRVCASGTRNPVPSWQNSMGINMV